MIKNKSMASSHFVQGYIETTESRSGLWTNKGDPFGWVVMILTIWVWSTSILQGQVNSPDHKNKFRLDIL